MVSLFWSSQTENFQKKRDFSKGSPKFPNGIAKRKTSLPFAFPHHLASLQTLSVNVKEFGKWYTPIPTKFPIREFFAYHLNKPSTNRFLLANGKQPSFLKLHACFTTCSCSISLGSLRNDDEYGNDNAKKQ